MYRAIQELRCSVHAFRAGATTDAGLLRFAGVIVYRCEHDLRAAAPFGVPGAGGLGLEIMTAIHLFEYCEVSALIIAQLGLVTAITMVRAAL